MERRVAAVKGRESREKRLLKIMVVVCWLILAVIAVAV